jgi:hypothetical protein
LRDYARRHDLAGVEGFRDVSAEFRTTRRGPVWFQQCTHVRPPGERPRPPDASGPETGWDRVGIIRSAEVWHGLILELEFTIDPARADEVAPLIWTAVEGMEVAERPAQPGP